MSRWRNYPCIVREIRIAYIIPELRRPVLKILGLRLAVWVSLPVTILLIAVPTVLWGVGAAISSVGQWAMKLPIYPTAPLHRARGQALEDAEAVMPKEEIRRRAYGEEITPLSKDGDA